MQRLLAAALPGRVWSDEAVWGLMVISASGEVCPWLGEGLPPHHRASIGFAWIWLCGRVGRVWQAVTPLSSYLKLKESAFAFEVNPLWIPHVMISMAYHLLNGFAKRLVSGRKEQGHFVFFSF